MDLPTNRMAKTKGRPTKAALEARPAPTPLAEAPIVVKGCVCPHCGKAMMPKTDRVNDSGSYHRCTSCGGRFRVWSEAGRRMVQALH